MRKILVHRCRNAEVDDGAAITCGCKEFVSRTAAEALVENYTAKWRANRRELIRTDRQPKTPRAATIERPHIQRAYLGTTVEPNGCRGEQRRIEIYGELSQQCLAELGAVLRPHCTNKRK